MHNEETTIKAPDPNDFGKNTILGAVEGQSERVVYDPRNKPFLFPFKRLLYSRKFMVLLLDVVVSTVLYFVGKYSASSIADDIGFLIGSYQPVILMMIYTIAKEDVAAINNSH